MRPSCTGSSSCPETNINARLVLLPPNTQTLGKVIIKVLYKASCKALFSNVQVYLFYLTWYSIGELVHNASRQLDEGGQTVRYLFTLAIVVRLQDGHHIGHQLGPLVSDGRHQREETVSHSLILRPKQGQTLLVTVGQNLVIRPPCKLG